MLNFFTQTNIIYNASLILAAVIILMIFRRCRKPDASDEGMEYEYRVARYLKRKGFKNVTVTKASRDYGVDIIARKRRRRYAIQCKYYSRPVGVSAVQEAFTGMAHYGCNAAMVVTNSTFTQAAETLAKENNVVLIWGLE